MKMKLEIKVSRKHIAKGTCEQCPITLAIKDAGGKNSRANYKNIEFTTSNGSYLIGKTPPIAKAFMLKFDNNKKVKPMTFVLAI
jgi:hypothetical protein